MKRPSGADLGLLALVTAINVLALPREEYLGDPVAVRIETVHLLRTGSLGVPAEIATRMGRRGQYFFENVRTGEWFSKYGALNTLLYVPPLLAERLATGSLDWVSPRRLPFLNAFNVLLGLASAAYLLAVVSLFTRDDAVKWVYVLSALYATFWWNYLRAQASEIYQTLFVIALGYHLFRHVRSVAAGPEAGTSRRQLLVAAAGLAALCLTKLVYVVLVPVVAGVLVVAHHERTRAADARTRSRERTGLAADMAVFAPAMAALALLLAAISLYKFGSPLLTGYEQLPEERDVLGGSLLVGLRGFAWSVRGSLFLHFPILIFALPAWPAFLRKWPVEGLAVGLVTLSLLLVDSRFGNWLGDACYGPRYMLPVLPLAALPFLETLGWIRRRLGVWRGQAVAVLLAAVVAFSIALQLWVNALPFFAYHFVRDAVLAGDDSAETAAFFDRPMGLVERDLLRSWNGRLRLRFLEKAAGDPAAAERVGAALRRSMRSNYMWFAVGPARRGT